MKTLCAGIFCIILSLLYVTHSSHAANLSQAQIRLDRIQADSQLAGLLCATPTSNATEGRVKIVFPNDFTISSSGWDTGTAGIPAGATAWPGVSFNSTSADSVTFNSGDLSTGTRYCFTFHGGSSKTGGTGDKTGEVQTLTSANSVIDTKMFGVTIKNNDRVTVSGQIAASASNFTAELEKVTSGNTFSQGQEIEYELTYTSGVSYATNIQVQASWTQGTVGNGTPSIDILEYVIGSAENAYNNAPPVVNTNTRTITWDITSFPGNTSRTTTFKLKTTDAFQDTDAVKFTVKGKILSGSTESTTSQIESNYKFSPKPTATPTPTAVISVTPTPAITSVSDIVFNTVAVTSVNSSSSQVEATFTAPVQAKLLYGTSPNSLTSSLTSAVVTTSHSFSIPDLLPETTYYFTVIGSGNSFQSTSDVFTFTTAAESEVPTVNSDTLILVSDNIVLLDPFLAQTGKNAIAVIPSGTSFQLKFKLDGEFKAEQIQLFLTPRDVLGINSFNQVEAAGFNTNMTEVAPNEFTGRLSTGNLSGFYQLFSRIKDDQGNITEEKIADIKITPRMRAIDTDGNGLEKIRLILSYFDETQKRFLPISAQGLSIPNPSYSDSEGYFNLTLPQATYRAQFSAIGYIPKEVDFTIGPNEGEEYPQIALEREPFNIGNSTAYYYESMNDLFYATLYTLIPLAKSQRFSELLGAAILVTFAVLSFVSFAAKTHFHVLSLPHFLRFHTKLLKNRIFSGVILDSTSTQPLSQVFITVSDPHTNSLLATAKTNKAGRFYVSSCLDAVHIQMSREGYATQETDLSSLNEKMIIKLEKIGTHGINIKSPLFSFIESVLSLSFGGILACTFLLEIVLMLFGNPIKVLPFLIISLLNMYIWIIFKRSHRIT